MKAEDVFEVLIIFITIAVGMIVLVRFIVPLFGPLFDFIVRGGR